MISIKHFFSLVKFGHTIFALPFALIGFTWGYVDLKIETSLSTNVPNLYLTFGLCILCMVFARNAAMGFNRYIDRSFDAKNKRTTGREIPAGLISPQAARNFVIINSLLFIACTYWINQLTFILAPVALFIILFYSYTKRFTSLCHFVLGMGLAIAPMGAYIAVTGKMALAPGLLSMIVLLWVSGFDILYALEDDNFDRSEGLHSIPTLLGRSGAMRLSSLLHFLTACLLIYLAVHFELGLLYCIGAGLFIGLLIYQHLIISINDLSRLNAAFFTTNGIASVIYSVFTISQLMINI